MNKPKGLPIPKDANTNHPKNPLSTPSSGTSINPKVRISKDNSIQGDGFEDFFSQDHEEEKLLSSAKEVYQKKTDDYEKIDKKIEEQMKKLQRENPAGGLAASSIITTEILLEAPKDYFHRFEKDVSEAVLYVQEHLAESGLSTDIGAAQNKPFDYDIQNIAYRHIQAAAAEFLERKHFRGIHRRVVIYMVVCDILKFSRITPLWDDRDVDEIMINGANDIQIERDGQLVKVPSCRFRDRQHLSNMCERIFATINKSLTKTTPLVDGRLYDNSRINAAHHSVCPEGPNVAIRRHPEKFWMPQDLVNFGAASEELFTYIGNLIYKACSYIVIGGTSSGKTTMLNATSCFFHPSQRIVSLEDNLELKLNPNKLVAAPMECLPGNPNKEGDKGVTMRDLVKNSLRMRPDGIVIGEIRDGAMYDLCQALNTGHWGCSTVHANSPYDGIYRMQSLVTQAEIMSEKAALPLIAAAFDFVIMVEHFPEDGSRKLTQVCEIDPYPTRVEGGHTELGIKPLWEFRAEEGLQDGKVVGEWVQVGELSDVRRKRRHLDLIPDKTWEEFQEIMSIEPQD